MRASDFDYLLPDDLIAQHPPTDRAGARLMVLERATGSLRESAVAALPALLRPGDLLVVNNSRVIPARLRGTKRDGGGQVEVLLLEERSTPHDWLAMLRPGKRVRPGTRLSLGPPASPCDVVVMDKDRDGLVTLRFPAETDVVAAAEQWGEVPLPPYIERAQPAAADQTRYQTVYAKKPGSVAAPTAGLHLSRDLMQSLTAAGITLCEVTLHVGMGTFAPVKCDDVDSHVMHEEAYEISPEAANQVEEARRSRRRIVAVGTTSLRVLESAARRDGGEIRAHRGRTRLFLRPPAEFQVVEALLTNFHLPRSTLLMLVCAFASPGTMDGRDWILRAYNDAIVRRYRFYSYGDAMLIL